MFISTSNVTIVFLLVPVVISMTQSQDEILANFQARTEWKTDRPAAVNFLKSTNWDLESGVQIFYIMRPDLVSKPNLNKPIQIKRSVPAAIPEESHHSFLPTSNGRLPPTTNNSSPSSNKRHYGESDLFRYIDENLIGKNHAMNGPWGPRILIYADYTASGRCLLCVEDYMNRFVMPTYSNTHSENNACAEQTTRFREGARALIKRAVNANEEDVLIFTGTGATGAIHKLMNVLRLSDPAHKNGTVVFYSAFEHHSNILPWDTVGCETVRIPMNDRGLFDQNVLREKLEKYRSGPVKKGIICSFNAASNVTGIRTDVDAVSTLVHQYNGFVFWDYASAAPYVEIDMNSWNESYKDAVFIATHKIVGGPGTPGILVAKRHLFQNPVPDRQGGGTVVYVLRDRVEYTTDIETREEGGTPDILGSIRAGLVFHLKGAVGSEHIEQREVQLVRRFFDRFAKNDKLIVLGSPHVSRLAIFSFLVRAPDSKNKFLHHNFVCSLLNDLFGIQVRSGCACAGPYVMDLLNINDETAELLAKFLTENPANRKDEHNNPIERNSLMKPGFTRFNLTYFASDEEVDYILSALEFIANDGWKILPLYTYDPNTAVWRHRDSLTAAGGHLRRLHSLGDVTYRDGGIRSHDPANHGRSTENFTFDASTADYIPANPLDEAKRIAADTLTRFRSIHCQHDPPLNIPSEYRHLIWFILPQNVIDKLLAEANHHGIPRYVPPTLFPQTAANLSNTSSSQPPMNNNRRGPV